LNKLGPVFQANLEDFSVIDLGDSDEVEVSVSEVVTVWKIFDELEKVSKVAVEK
jgi:hypothetical protein